MISALYANETIQPPQEHPHESPERIAVGVELERTAGVADALAERPRSYGDHYD